MLEKCECYNGIAEWEFPHAVSLTVQEICPTMDKAKWRAYPRPEKSECGCKVSWNWYASKVKAQKCAEAATWNASIAEREGFDFGYACPGEIVNDDGLFKVTLP